MSFDGVAAAATGRRELRIGLLCAALLLAIWSCFTLLSRLGVKTNFPPADLMLLRVGVGGLIVMPWFLRTGLAGLSVRQAVFMALTAGIGFSAFSYVAFNFAPAAHASVLQTATLPLNTAILAVLVLGERFRRTKLLGLGLIVLGVVLMGYESLTSGEPGQWRGDVLFYAASLSWAVYSVFAQRWGVRPLQAAAIVYAISALMYLPVYAIFFHPHLLQAPVGELAVQVILQGVLANLVSIFAFTRIVQAFGASSTAMLTAASPVVVALLAIPFLGEIPTALGWAGLASVVLGIVATMLVLETRRA